MIDLLVHEASHNLLFGVAAEGPLTHNPGEERLPSPLRRDPRPIEGIFHACFVATRVHLALTTLLTDGSLGPRDAAEAEQRKRRNGEAAVTGLDTLAAHAKPTDLGSAVIAEMQDYWAKATP